VTNAGNDFYTKIIISNFICCSAQEITRAGRQTRLTRVEFAVVFVRILRLAMSFGGGGGRLQTNRYEDSVERSTWKSYFFRYLKTAVIADGDDIRIHKPVTKCERMNE